jgi:hypothetical protein
MSSDDKKEKSYCDILIHRNGLPSYIQVKTYGKGSRKVNPANEWNIETQEAFVAIRGAFQAANVERADLFVSFEDEQTKSKAVEIENELISTEKLLDSWKIEPEAPLTVPIIERPPGHRLIVILQSVLPKSVFDRVYGQMVADSREEYYEALSQGDSAEAKKIKRQLNYHLVGSVFSFLAGLPAHLLMKPFKLFDKGE